MSARGGLLYEPAGAPWGVHEQSGRLVHRGHRVHVLEQHQAVPQDLSIKELVRKYPGRGVFLAWKLVSPEAKEFVSSLLRFDPGERPTAAGALQMSLPRALNTMRAATHSGICICAAFPSQHTEKKPFLFI